MVNCDKFGVIVNLLKVYRNDYCPLIYTITNIFSLRHLILKTVKWSSTFINLSQKLEVLFKKNIKIVCQILYRNKFIILFDYILKILKLFFIIKKDWMYFSKLSYQFVLSIPVHKPEIFQKIYQTTDTRSISCSNSFCHTYMKCISSRELGK